MRRNELDYILGTMLDFRANVSDLIFTVDKPPQVEAEGILVVTKGESEGPYRIGPVYLWVPEQYEVQARVILAEVTAGSRDTRSDSMETEETTGQS